MKKAAVVYHSKTGNTRAFAEAIAQFCGTRGIEARAVAIAEASAQELAEADYLLLGCWTSGLLVVLQHPDQPWVEFASKLSAMKAEKVGLFTTYKVATGGMFRKMAACLHGKTAQVSLELKSRGRQLSEQQKQELQSFLG